MLKKNYQWTQARLYCILTSNEELYVVAKYRKVLTKEPWSDFFRENTEKIEGPEHISPAIDEGSDPMKLVPNLILM